jgi:hypothetical protein
MGTKPAVEVVGGVDVSEKNLEIHAIGEPHALRFALYFDGPPAIAFSNSAKALASWAFYNGANSVRHAYDMSIHKED